jgi:hypothetical protein
MKRFMEAFTMLLFSACCGLLQSAEVLKEKWISPQVGTGFSRELGMLDSEREEYANHLAALGANLIVRGKGSADAITQGRRMLGLALQLSPRNKAALVTCFQLSRGLLPEPGDPGLSNAAFARLLQARGKLLGESERDEDRVVGRYFISLAAELDPKNHDAVYASEIMRLDLGEVDWRMVTDVPERAAKTASP